MNDDIKRMRAEIAAHREAIRRMRLTLPERRPGHDALKRLRIECAISERRALIRDLKSTIATLNNLAKYARPGGVLAKIVERMVGG